MSEYKTPFKDAICDSSKPSFNILPTLGDTPGMPGNSANQGVSGTVKPVELPNEGQSLWHDMGK